MAISVPPHFSWEPEEKRARRVESEQGLDTPSMMSAKTPATSEARKEREVKADRGVAVTLLNDVARARDEENQDS